MLEHPIWNALTTDHASFALVNGDARRYPERVARFAAVREPTPAAFADLRALVPAGDGVGLFCAVRPDVPELDWRIIRDRSIEQMVCDEPPGEPAPGGDVLELGPADAPEMLALARATEPGPFKIGTVDMGRYLGVRVDGRLVAMAGERLRVPGWVEISGVCTDPQFRGRGYARALMLELMQAAFATGRRPFLHVKNENGAKRLYVQLGFRVSRTIHLLGLTPR